MERVRSPELLTRPRTPMVATKEFVAPQGWQGKFTGSRRVEYPSGAVRTQLMRCSNEASQVYDGEWDMGDYHGWGTFTAFDGNQYEGGCGDKERRSPV